MGAAGMEARRWAEQVVRDLLWGGEEGAGDDLEGDEGEIGVVWHVFAAGVGGWDDEEDDGAGCGGAERKVHKMRM